MVLKIQHSRTSSKPFIDVPLTAQAQALEMLPKGREAHDTTLTPHPYELLPDTGQDHLFLHRSRSVKFIVVTGEKRPMLVVTSLKQEF